MVRVRGVSAKSFGVDVTQMSIFACRYFHAFRRYGSFVDTGFFVVDFFYRLATFGWG